MLGGNPPTIGVVVERRPRPIRPCPPSPRRHPPLVKAVAAAARFRPASARFSDILLDAVDRAIARMRGGRGCQTRWRRTASARTSHRCRTRAHSVTTAPPRPTRIPCGRLQPRRRRTLCGICPRGRGRPPDPLYGLPRGPPPHPLARRTRSSWTTTTLPPICTPGRTPAKSVR